jgi:hypothetical protein
MGWLPTAVLIVLGIVLLALPGMRVLGALRRARAASETLNTSVTGRARRISAGVAEVRIWRTATAAVAPETPAPETLATSGSAGSIEATCTAAERNA